MAKLSGCLALVLLAVVAHAQNIEQAEPVAVNAGDFIEVPCQSLLLTLVQPPDGLSLRTYGKVDERGGLVGYVFCFIAPQSGTIIFDEIRNGEPFPIRLRHVFVVGGDIPDPIDPDPIDPDPVDPDPVDPDDPLPDAPYDSFGPAIARAYKSMPAGDRAKVKVAFREASQAAIRVTMTSQQIVDRLRDKIKPLDGARYKKYEQRINKLSESGKLPRMFDLGSAYAEVLEWWDK